VYTLLANSSVLRDSDGATIPNDPDNSDWQAYQAWVDAGNTPAPIPSPPVVIPPSVSLWQAKAALQAGGLLTAANAAVAAANDEVLSLYWASATNISRNAPSLLGIATALSLSSAQVDALFVTANSIEL
jgi:hypothetical protein